MTFTMNKRIIEKYKVCDGMYMGFGPVNAIVKRLKISAFWSKRRKYKGRMKVMLSVA